VDIILAPSVSYRIVDHPNQSFQSHATIQSRISNVFIGVMSPSIRIGIVNGDGPSRSRPRRRQFIPCSIKTNDSKRNEIP
jgi:hypothetical protein